MVDYSKYPSQIDSTLELPLATDNITPVKAEVVNRLRSAILAIESELGVDPSREYGSVRARLDALDSMGAGGGSIEILLDGVQILPSVIGIDFIGNVLVSSSQPLRAQVEVIGGQATQVQETITVSTNGQSSFTLSDLPIQDSGLMMYVNGVKQQRGVDYTSFNTSVTYSGISLTTLDKVEFWYLVEVGDIHAHGNQLGGSLHSEATQLEAGFMSATDKIEHDLIASIVDADGLTFSEDQTTITFAQTQDLTATGAAWSLRAQQGAAGFNGGSLTLGGGDPGTNGTEYAGNTYIKLGALGAGSLSAKVILDINGTDFGSLYNYGGYFRIANEGAGGGLWLYSGTAGYNQTAPFSQFYEGGTPRLKTTYAAALTEAYDASCSSVSFSQDQDTSAAGAAWSIRSQRGFAGFIGGTLTLGGGDGGTGGTNLAGETIIQLGQTVSNASANLRIKADSTTLATFRQSASGTLELDCGSNALNILATGGVSIKVRYTTFTSGTASLVADTINLLTSTTSAATLPAASTWSGFTITVKKVNIAGDIVVSRTGADTIDGATTYTITGAYGTASFASDGTDIYAFPAA